VTILEPNEISYDRSADLFKQFRQKVNIENKSLFDFDKENLKKFDIVVCDGVLQHTYNPIKGLEIIASGLKKGAILLLSIGEYHGVFKRMLQRKLIFGLAGKNEEKIVSTAKKYFQEHIDRAVRFGLRLEDSVIYDSYVNPQVMPPKLIDICDVLLRNNVRYLSAYPTLNFFLETRPWTQDKVNKFNYEYFKNYYQFLEKIWMTCGEENLEDMLKRFDLSAIYKKITHDADILCRLKDKIEKLSFKDNGLKIIQKGYLGVGINYFTGVKETVHK
jgi:SAM-dependent methyltransferase